MAHWTGDGRWDALGSVAIGFLLITIAIVLMIEMKGLLIGEGRARPTWTPSPPRSGSRRTSKM